VADEGDKAAGRDAAAAGAPEPADEGRDKGRDEAGRPNRTFWWVLLAICVVALGIRVGYTVGWKQVDTIGGDAYYYHRAANLLADGKGFVHPYAYDKGISMPGADHPPGWIIVLALPSLLGFDTILSHQLVGCLLGTGTIALLGVTGRRIAGDRVGLIAAGVGAIYPGLWLPDATLMSESLALLCGTVVILTAYQAWEKPSARRFALVGGAIGLATLARAEAFMLVGLLVLPLAAWVPKVSGARARLGRFALGAGAFVLVVSPWVVANLIRFEEPALLSTQMGPTLEAAYCEDTFYGHNLGSWSLDCITDWGDRDRSVLDRLSRQNAVDYLDEHRGRLPRVMAARVLRTFNLAHVSDQVNFDWFAEARPINASWAAVASFWVLGLTAIAGVVVLRHRGVPSFPLLSTVANVLITVLVFYGSTRFRSPAEPAIVLLAAVAFDATIRRLRRDSIPAT
jgi:4-amino-4-deoxy-L-arabinose transferase-like glycosyltransferase